MMPLTSLLSVLSVLSLLSAQQVFIAAGTSLPVTSPQLTLADEWSRDLYGRLAERIPCWRVQEVGDETINRAVFLR